MRLLAPLLLAAALVSGCESEGAQIADTNADVSVASPAFAPEAGPRVVIDAAHNNFHTIDGRYAPFAALLRNDGLRVSGSGMAFTDESLVGVGILVVANANFGPSGNVFTDEEVAAVARYVEAGGSLLLIADHTPYAGAAGNLAAAFGVQFADVFVEDDGSGMFTREDGELIGDPVIGGVTRVRTFSGSAFRAPGARPLLVLGDGWTMQHMAANGLSEKHSATGLLQGALIEHGAGRVAVFGEAAMFSAQIESGGLMRQRTGFNARGAEQNKQFVLNVVRWLARVS